MAKIMKKSVAKAESVVEKVVAQKEKVKTPEPVKVEPVVEKKKMGRPPKATVKTPESIPATVTPKKEKEEPKTAKAAQKTVQQKTVATEPVETKKEVLADVIKTKKSTFNKVEVKTKEDLAEGVYIFADEGNSSPSVFRLVYVGGLMYMVDITSKDENFEGFIALDIKDVVAGELAGVKIAVYEKE